MRQSRNKFGYQAWVAVYFNSDAEKKAAAVKEMKGALEVYSANYIKYTKANFMPEESKLHEGVKQTIIDYMAVMKKIADFFELNQPEKFEEGKQLLIANYRQLGSKVGTFNEEVAKLYAAEAEHEGREADEITKSAFNIMILVTAMSTLLIFGMLLWTAAKVSNSVSSIAQRLTSAGAQVTTSVEQLNEAGNSLSQSSTEAAASLEETVASLEEMSSMVQMNSDNARQAASLSVSSREAAEKGEVEIQNLIKSMNEIAQSSKKIEEIISVIDDIAFQTNLLALNAAVEAARAGEQGKGFAVVAEAVRALAQRSAVSAKDIASLIKESVGQIEQGRETADRSGAVLNNIVNSIKKVSDLNTEISTASSEQTSGIQQISKAMNQLDQAAQSNAASAEELAATSSEISGLAVSVQEMTGDLNNVILGPKGSPVANVVSIQSGKNHPSKVKDSSKDTVFSRAA
jgi:methyl-accepting chemotaxis protein